MYNHTTNHWTSEHLRQLDPRHPLAWEYLQKYMDDWCAANPQTNVVRLTSLFYNFVWIFGDDVRRPSRFVDWASYDFTVSPAALRAFEAEYGYALTAEDFINKGLLQATHRTPSACPGGDTFFRMAHVLGVDEDDGRYACHAKWENGVHPEELNPALRWTDPEGRIVSVGPLKMAVHTFGRGMGAYLGGFTCSPEAAGALLQALVMLSRADAAQLPACGHPCVETAWFPASKTLVVMNNSEEAVTASIDWMGRREIALEPMEMRFVQV